MTKEQLREYRAIRDELTGLEALHKRLTSIDPSGELPALYGEKIEALAGDLQRMEETIASLGPTERALMRLRYVEGLPWQDICRRLHYSWAQIHRIHSGILIKIKGEDNKCD